MEVTIKLLNLFNATINHNFKFIKMEITLRVVLSADADLLVALQALTGQKSVTQKTVWREGGINNPEGSAIVGDKGEEIIATGANSPVTEKKTRKVKELAEISKAEITNISDKERESIQSEHTLDSLREMAVPLSKAGHKDAIQAKTRELGLTTIAHLQPAQFDEFYAFLQTLK